MVLFNGFKPTGGTICNISIYPSEFGAKRMAEEHKHGPVEFTENCELSDDKESERYLLEISFLKFCCCLSFALKAFYHLNHCICF